MLFFDVIANSKDNQDTVFANITTHTGDVLHFKVDTGTQAKIIPHSMFAQMTTPLQQSKDRLISYTGQQLSIKGCINVIYIYKGSTYEGPFHIVYTASNSQPVLRLQASLQLQLIKLVLSVDPASAMKNETTRKEYGHLFTGLSSLEGETTIHPRLDATPVIHPVQHIPHAIKDKLKEELDKMEESMVIMKVTEPTDWVNFLVVVKKPNGKLRICLNPKDLNTAISSRITPC